MLTNILIFIFSLIGINCFAEPFMQTIDVPMRDGFALPTDIYMPDSQSKNLPCILIRSPAGRQQLTAKNFIPLTKQGYVIAIQGTRSNLDVEGKTIPYRADGWCQHLDGYDTVEWLAKSPLTNGRVGTVGSSAQGITQLLMAPTAPPSLKCQYIAVAAPTLKDHAIYPNGKLLKHQVEAWLGYYAGNSGVWNFVVNHQFYDEFWEEFDSIKVVDRVNVPGVLQGGWYDMFIQGTLDAFTARQENGGNGAKGKQKLVIGPWTHFWPAVKKLGDYDVPKEGLQPPVDISPERWFDHYLKENPNSVVDIPPVTYYVMGPFDGSPSSGNKWCHAEKWPIPFEEKSYYIKPDGKLTEKLWSDLEKGDKDSFLHDPQNPVPTIGGNNLFLASGPMDQRPIENRSDVLVYTSDPLEADMEVTGRIKVSLFVSSDKDDTDYIVRLTDVYPDGKSLLVCDGAFRTGLLGLENPSRNPEDIHPITLDLGSTSMVFAKGHQIRISIAGSNYPRYELNFNTGLVGSNPLMHRIAVNKVHFGADYPSRLILPKIP